MRPADRSAPAVQIANAAPMATIRRVELWIRMFLRFPSVRNEPRSWYQAKAEMASESLDDKFAKLEKEDEVEKMLTEIKQRRGKTA